MEKVQKIKLSELSDDVEVAILDSHTTYTVAELKREIIELVEPHHESSNWHTLTRKRWTPSAEIMIDNYIESEYCEMYEDWDERAKDCIAVEVVEKIQAILDEAFKGDHATAYWTYEDPVEIDIFPKEVPKFKE
ncbi:hypothetical protein P9265_14935 [Schinkia azotoformans]|uniref:hypothetical protein n=1 Tax=Schinkia azotoformans TaxID=1454 RepID=UPI002E1EB991|nr:hypothetical protein [Schinkia azotoformans]